MASNANSRLDGVSQQHDVQHEANRPNHEDPVEHIKRLQRIELLEIVVNSFPGGISVFDQDLILVLCNDQAKQLLDYPQELFAEGAPTLEEVLRFNAERGEYGPGDIDEQVAHRMALARKCEAHQYQRVRPNGTVVEVRGVPLAGGGFVTTHLDVTEQHRQTRQLEVVLENFPGGISLFDQDLNMVLCNDQQKQLLNYSEELFADGLPTMEELFRFNAQRGEYGPGDVEEQVRRRMELARQRTAHTYQRERPNGTVLEIRGVPLAGGGFVTTYLDVTERHEQMRHIEAVLHNFPGGISLFDKHLNMVLCNEQQKQLLNYPDELFEDGLPTLEEIFRFNAERGEYGPGDVEEHVQRRIALAQRRQAHEYERARPDGSVLEVRGVPLEGSGFITTYLDVTERRRSQERVAHMAHHDALTDLPNRLLFNDRFAHALAQARRGYKMALLYLDLDKFKPVNDTLGHAVGDKLLQEVAARLLDSIRDTDTVARLGGDEFAIIQVGIEGTAGAERLANRIIEQLHRPFEIEGHKVEIGTSIGVALAPEDGVDPDELMRLADLALYRCKAEGRGTVRFSASMKLVSA